MICGNWVFYIEIPKHHFDTTITNSKRTYNKRKSIPRKEILTKFPEITFFRPFNKYQNIMIFGVTTIRYIPLCLLRTSRTTSVKSLQIT